MLSTKRNQIENITPEFLSMIKCPTDDGKKLNYLMVVPSLGRGGDDFIYPFPIGIAYVSSALKASGRNVFTLNMSYKEKPGELLQRTIVDSNIDVVMVGGVSTQFWALKNIIDAAKQAKSEIVAVVGGGIITTDPILGMEALGESADYGVIGEGEITVNALAYALETDSDPAELDGIICLKDGKWSVRENWPLIPNLDILPFPDYEGFEYGQIFDKNHNISKTYSTIGSSNIGFVTIARSCPFKCTYCVHTCGDTYRRYSLDVFFKMLDWLLSLYPEIEALMFLDELMFSNHDMVIEFCRRIEPYNLRWRCIGRVDMFKKESLVAMKESGCVHITLGIESADNRILKSMRKHTTVEQIEKLYEYAEEIGFPATGNFIFGDLEETMETVWNSINWYLTYSSRILDLRLISSYPGTHMYKVAVERGIIKDRVQFLKDGCPPVNVSKLTDHEYNTLPILFTLVEANKLKDAEIEPSGNLAVNLSGQCPHCAKELSYKNFEYLFEYTSQICPDCQRALFVRAIECCDFDKLNKNGEILLAHGSSAAVWGVNERNFYWLLRTMPVLQANNVRFVNKDKIVLPDYSHIFEKLNGFEDVKTKEVFTPDIIVHEGVDTVIVPNSPEVFEQIKAQCMAEFPHVKRIAHITELF